MGMQCDQEEWFVTTSWPLWVHYVFVQNSALNLMSSTITEFESKYHCIGFLLEKKICFEAHMVQKLSPHNAIFSLFYVLFELFLISSDAFIAVRIEVKIPEDLIEKGSLSCRQPGITWPDLSVDDC